MSVLFEVKDHAARITIDRPDRMNAVDTETNDKLESIWREIEENGDIRCAVLTGSGDRAFSAGADLKDDSGKSGIEYWTDSGNNGFGGIALRQSMKTPVIARGERPRSGWWHGNECSVCDVVIAAETARFGLPEAKVGRVPLEGGMVLLQRLIPRNVAVAMMMTGRLVSAEEMAKFGLVNSVVSSDQLDAETDRWIEDILTCAPLSLKAIKATVRDTAQMSPQDALAFRSNELIAALGSEDSDEGVTAFREKRPPVWQGR